PPPPAPSSELHHPRRLVDRDHLGGRLPSQSFGELTFAAADLEDPLGLALDHRLEPHLAGARALRAAVRRLPGREPSLVRVLGADDCRIVHQCSMIGLPGTPRGDALPPSHALTAAPTSENTPSCVAPPAFRPSTYAISIACSREWSVDGV